MLQVGVNSEKLLWTIDGAVFLSQQGGNAKFIDIDVPPALEGVPKAVSVSILGQQGKKVKHLLIFT